MSIISDASKVLSDEMLKLEGDILKVFEIITEVTYWCRKRTQRWSI